MTFSMLCMMFGAIAAAPWVVDPLVYLGSGGRGEIVQTPYIQMDTQFLEAPSLESLSPIVERPLFTATRRPAPDVQPTPVVAVAEPLDESLILGRYKLTGIVVTPGLRMVFVTKPGSKKTIAVARGKQLDGWLVSEVERNVITLVSGDLKKHIKIGEDAAIEIISE